MENDWFAFWMGVSIGISAGFFLSIILRSNDED